VIGRGNPILCELDLPSGVGGGNRRPRWLLLASRNVRMWPPGMRHARSISGRSAVRVCVRLYDAPGCVVYWCRTRAACRSDHLLDFGVHGHRLTNAAGRGHPEPIHRAWWTRSGMNGACGGPVFAGGCTAWKKKRRPLRFQGNNLSWIYRCLKFHTAAVYALRWVLSDLEGDLSVSLSSGLTTTTENGSVS